MGAVRLAGFAAIVVCIAEAVARPEWRGALSGAAIVCAIGFAVLVRWSARLNRERRDARDLAQENEQGLYRVERDWSRISSTTGVASNDDGTLADLNVFGRASLAALLPSVSVALGRPCLQAWLSSSAPIEEILRRQDGIRELTPAFEYRQQMAVFGKRAHTLPERIAGFREWAAAPSATTAPWLVVASFIIPILTIGGIAVAASGVVDAPVWRISIVAAIVIAGATHAATRRRLRPAFTMAVAAESYAEMLSTIERQPWTSGRLAALKDSLRSDQGTSAGECFRRLSNIASSAETIASPMLHAVLQVLVLWDLHTARRLDAWRAECGSAVGRWLETLGEIESLTALATLAYDNPDWTFPSIQDQGVAEIRANALGHPLLPAQTRVPNDVVVGPPGKVQLISGSNMSGKSTLLRAVGLNLVLARTGAPVSAASLTTPMVDILTSIQIHDSLGEGVSYFMAELQRLKTIVDAADHSREAGALPVVYLIDEILRGTNSEERAVAARLIVRRLAEAGAIGVVTTHDLGIFSDANVTPYVEHHHFRETIETVDGREQMTFDYRLHNGPTTSRNALRLLAIVGIGEK